MATIAEQRLVSCAEVLARWDALLLAAGRFDAERKADFDDVARRSGIEERAEEVREACGRPGGPVEEDEEAIEALAVDLDLLEEAMEISGRLDLSVGDSLAAVAQTRLDEDRAARGARLREAVLPVVLGLAGGVVSTLVVEAIADAIRG